MEARAINRYIGSSPRKMRLVIDLIRGKSVDDALHILHFSPKHASKVAEKVLRSAVSNLQGKDEAGRIDASHMFVKEAYVNPAVTLKRINPAPMGRAYRIRKRANHVTIVVATHEVVAAKRGGTPAVPGRSKEKKQAASAAKKRTAAETR